MTSKQSTALIYGAPFTAIMLIVVSIKGRFFGDGLTTVLVSIFCVAACILAVIGLKQASRGDTTWLPSFAALTTFKVLAFCAGCTAATLLIKDHFDINGPLSSPPVTFMVLLLAAPLFAISSLLSVLVFLIASLTVRLVPKLLKTDISPQSKTKAVQAANITAFSLGLFLIFVVCKVG